MTPRRFRQTGGDGPPVDSTCRTGGLRDRVSAAGPVGCFGRAVLAGKGDTNRSRRLAAVWVVCVAVLGGGLLTVRAGASPLDDPDQARQRPGFSDANPPRSVAPRLTGLGPAGSRGVVFFTRPDRLTRLLAALGGDDGGRLSRRAHVVVVLPVTIAVGARTGVTVLADPTGSVSRLLFMRIPRDGGYPVGYAVVGPDGTVRYRTEDPGQDLRLSEVLMAVGDT